MAASQSSLGKVLLWGCLSALLYWGLYHFADDFIRLAHTTRDVCAVQTGMQTTYYHQASAELCAARGGNFIRGTWWYVFAPILMAFALSYVHGMFTGLFWDAAGLKPKKQ